MEICLYANADVISGTEEHCIKNVKFKIVKIRTCRF